MKYALILLGLCALMVANDANQSKFNSFFDRNLSVFDANSSNLPKNSENPKGDKQIKIPTH